MKKPTNLFKRAAIALMAASIVAATPTVVSAAWETTGKGWNWIVNGQKATGWQWIDSQWYYMDSTGTMKTGWIKDGSSWYYLAPSGAMKTGWAQVDGVWYYLKSSGAMATGWVLDNGSWYRMNSSGAMVTGWTSWNDGWYYMAPAGDMVTGVAKINGVTYCMDANGKMQTGEVTIAGKTYTFNEEGAAEGDAPEASRTFVTGAAGTTETTSTATNSGTGTATTPTKRPSTGGGGGSSTPSEPDTPDTPDVPDTPDTPDTPSDRTDVAEAKTITTAAEWNEFKADMATNNYTGGVTINLTGAEIDGEIDLSDLKTSSVTIESLPTGKTSVTVNSECAAVVVKTACTVNSNTELPAVTVNASGSEVTVAAPVENLTATAADKVTVSKAVGAVTASAPLEIATTGNVETLSTGADVTVNGTVENVIATGGIEISGTGKVDSVAAGSNNITVSAAVDRVTAETGVVTVADGGDIAELETGANVNVKEGAAVDKVISTAATGSPITIDVEENATVTTVVGIGPADSDESSATVKVTGAGSTEVNIKEPAAAPEEDTDYTVTDANEDSPTKGKIVPSAGGKSLEYLDGTTWKPIPEAGIELSVGSHSVRTAADASTDKEASVSVSVNIEGYTGFGTDGFYYAESVKSTTTGWQIVSGVDYWLVNGKKGGAKTWQVSKDQSADAKHWTYVDENSKATANVFDATTVTGGVEINGMTSKMQYKLSTDTTWTAVTSEQETAGKVEGLSKGTYQISYKTDENMTASPVVEVKVTLAKAETPTNAVTSGTATDDNPTKGILELDTENFGEKASGFEYRVKPEGDEDVDEDANYKPLVFTDSNGKKIAIVEPGTYQIRLAETESNSASDPIEVTAEGYTGFVTKDGVDNYYDNGKLIVTFDPSKITVDESGELPEIDSALTVLDDQNKDIVGLYTKDQNGDAVEFTKTVWENASAGDEFIVYAGVIVEDSVELSPNPSQAITKPEN